MRIELMAIPRCHGIERSRLVLRDFLRDTGQSFVETAIHNEDETKAVHFLGSQQFRLMGEISK